MDRVEAMLGQITPKHDNTTVIKATKRPLNIVLTNPDFGFQSFIESILTGGLFGPQQPINLTLLYVDDNSTTAGKPFNIADSTVLLALSTTPCQITIINKRTDTNTTITDNTSYYRKSDLVIFTFNAEDTYTRETGDLVSQFDNNAELFHKEKPTFKFLIAPSHLQTPQQIARFCTITSCQLKQYGFDFQGKLHQIQGLALHHINFAQTQLVNNINTFLHLLNNSTDVCKTTLPYLTYASVTGLYAVEGPGDSTAAQSTFYSRVCFDNALCLDYPSIGHITPLTAVLSRLHQLSQQTIIYNGKSVHLAPLFKDIPSIKVMNEKQYATLLSLSMVQHLQQWLGMTQRGKYMNIITQAEADCAYAIGNVTNSINIKKGQYANLPVMSYYGHVGVMKPFLLFK